MAVPVLFYRGPKVRTTLVNMAMEYTFVPIPMKYL